MVRAYAGRPAGCREESRFLQRRSTCYHFQNRRSDRFQLDPVKISRPRRSDCTAQYQDKDAGLYQPVAYVAKVCRTRQVAQCAWVLRQARPTCDQSREQLLAKIGNVPPSFPPTKAQFQTIGNKPSADAEGDPPDPYNAFLFTEMCGVPGITTPWALPQNDLQWSDNWFYGVIVGSLAMSSTIFLREFVGKFVEPIHKDYSAFDDTLASGKSGMPMFG